MWHLNTASHKLGYCRKNSDGRTGDILSRKTLKILCLLLWVWKFWANQSFLWKFCKTVLHSWKFKCQKSTLVEIPHDFFLVTTENSTSFFFFNYLQEFPQAFSSTHKKFYALDTIVWIFFGIAHYDKGSSKEKLNKKYLVWRNILLSTYIAHQIVNAYQGLYHKAFW